MDKSTGIRFYDTWYVSDSVGVKKNNNKKLLTLLA